MAPYKIWTKSDSGCDCDWKKNLLGACACCFKGGKQCDNYKFKDRCIASNGQMSDCKLDKIKNLDPTVPPDPYIIPNKEEEDHHDDPNDFHGEHEDQDKDCHMGRNGKCEHDYPIPISPAGAVVKEILNQMEQAFNGKEQKPTTNWDVPTQGSCNPSGALYVPLFFWPSANEDNSGEQKCRDPFWLSLRHGGSNVNIVVQTRTIPQKVQDLERQTIQACIDHVVTGETKVLGYVDADFQHRPMKDILGDVKAWASQFKNLDGIYMDPIGISLKGQDLNSLLANVAKFIRENISDFKNIVFSPQPDFYRF